MRIKDKNYFKIPNAIFSLDLSAKAIALYSFLLKCENRKDFTCYPSYGVIGRAIKSCANTIRVYVNELVDKKLIEVTPTKILRRGKVQNGNLKFRILPIEVAVKFFDEEQMRRLREENTRIKVQRSLEKFDAKRAKTSR